MADKRQQAKPAGPPPLTGKWEVDVLNELGAEPNRRTLGFLRSWQKWEGGHTNNTARFNWLNTSRKGYGGVSAAISVAPHIKRFPSYGNGVRATADTLLDGYPNLVKAFKDGNVNLHDPEVQGDLNYWLTGTRRSGMSSYVKKIGSTFGAWKGDIPHVDDTIGRQADDGSPVTDNRPVGAPPETGAPTVGVEIPTQVRHPAHQEFSKPLFAQGLLGAIQGGKLTANRLLDAIGGAQAEVPASVTRGVRMAQVPLPPDPQRLTPTLHPAAGSRIPHRSSSQLILGSKPRLIGTPYAPGSTHGKAFNAAHGSDNWESENALDLATHMRTPIYAPADGIVGPKFGSLGSGGRFAGLRMHLVTQGNEFYLAHLSGFAKGIEPGVHVKAGQLLGFSGQANNVPHLHIATRRGDPRHLVRWR